MSGRVARTVLAALRDEPSAAWAAAGWTALATVPAFFSGWAMSHALDDGFLRHQTAVGLGWLAVPAVTIVPGAVGAKRSVRAVGEIVEPFRDRLVERLVDTTITDSLDPAAIPTTPGVLAALGQQVEAARMGLAGTISCVLGLACTLAAVLIGQASLAPVVALLTAAPLVLGALLFAATMPAVLRTQRALVGGGEELSATVQATAQGLRDIRAAGAHGWAEAQCVRDIEAQARITRTSARLTGLRLLIVGLGGRAPAALLLIAAPWLVRRGISPGALAGSLTYNLATLAPAMQSLSDAVSTLIIPLWVNLERLTAAEPRAIPEPEFEPVAAHPVLRSLDIGIHGLTFAYGQAAEPVLDRLDLTVPAGGHLAVVGASGTGKSTLAALICGVLRPTAGTVRIGGQDPAATPARELPRLRVYLPQQAHVFTGTLGENLRYLEPSASDAALDRAVAALGMTELCERLGGYAGRVEPARLDSGQRQLIALTRAWLSPAPLAVLDEATCHLDPAAEELAEQAFMTRPGTLIVIAHRISSARRAEQILVLDGAQTRCGNHHQLLTTSPMYRDLVGHWEQTSDRSVRFPVFQL